MKYFIAEIILFIIILCTLVLEIVLKKNTKNKIIHTFLSIGFSLLFFYTLYAILCTKNTNTLIYHHLFTYNTINIVGRNVLVIGAIIIYFIAQQENNFQTEHYLFILGALLGNLLFITSCHWLMTYVSLVLSSLCYYFLIFNVKKLYTSLIYMLYQVIGSLVLLWGISYFFYATGNFYYTYALGTSTSMPILFWLNASIFLICIGFFLKLGIVPLHFWLPPIYYSVPISVIAYINFSTKITLFIWMVQFFSLLENFTLLQPPFILLGMVTFLYGNLMAYQAKKLPTLIAYYTIGQNGFLLCCCTFFRIDLYYTLFIYVVITNAILLFLFYLIVQYKKHIQNKLSISVKYDKYIIYGCILVCIIALIGLPPTATFWSKLSILMILWKYYTIKKKICIIIVILFLGINWLIMSLYGIKMLQYFLVKKKIQNASLTPIVRTFMVLIIFLVLGGFFYPNWLSIILQLLTQQK